MRGRVFVRAVFGYEKQYAVSNTGNIYSFERNGNWRFVKLKPTINHNGYERVTLFNNSKRRSFFVHRIVAENFLDNPENKRTVNHINAIKTDNSIKNLEWATHSENTQHAVDNNLAHRAKGSEMSKVLKEEDILNIIELRRSGMTHKSIGIALGRPATTIQSILNGRRWSHITGIKYKIDKPL